MRALVRFTTACIAGLASDALMKSFCMSCNTKAVFARPIGGNGAPFIVAPFLLFSRQRAGETKSEIRISKSETNPKKGKFEIRSTKSETNRSQINQKP